MARRLQAVVRGWLARKHISKKRSIHCVSVRMLHRHPDLAGLFDEACRNASGQAREGLNESLFKSLFLKLNSSASSRQVMALWDGFISNSEDAVMDIGTFCSIAEAVSM